MSKNRVIVSSVIIEGRSKSEVAGDLGVTYRWVHTLVTRYHQGGWPAVEPRSRRPRTNPRRTPPDVEDRIVQLRATLSAAGHDAGPATIAAHLHAQTGTSPNPSMTCHRALDRRTPADTYHAHPKDSPPGNPDSHWRIRHDRIDTSDVVTLRYNSRLHHIGIGRAHAGTPVLLLIHNRTVRIVDPDTGELLRDLTLDPSHDYQPQQPPK